MSGYDGRFEKRLRIIAFGGAALGALVLAIVLTTLRRDGLLPARYSWTVVIATPISFFFLIAGIAIVQIIRDRFGLLPGELRSFCIEFLYFGTLVFAIWLVFK